MTYSIRRFLLINLLLTISIATTLTIGGNYYLNQQEIRTHLDTTLTQVGLLFRASLREHLNPQSILQIQKQLNRVPLETALFLQQPSSERYNYNDKYQFQIWGPHGKLLLHTPKAPLTPLSKGAPGFSTAYIDNMWWRIFTIHDPNTGIRFMVAEPFNIRNQLIYRIIKGDLYMMLLVYPLSAILIWLIVGRGLGTIRRIANEISSRAAHHLEPVKLNIVPLEIRPLVSELNTLLQGLHDAFEREKRFAADAAHELKTPLAGIRTQAQVALRAADPAERERLLNNVIVGVDRSAHVVQQLLTLSRLAPETSQLEECAPIHLGGLITEVIGQLVYTALDKHIELTFSPPKKIQPIIYGNPGALSILIRNLIDNAIRYTPEYGHVEILLSVAEDEVIFQVNDDGPGIAPELYQRVFERFYRVLGNSSPGSGLGLSIVKQIATLHQARITLDVPPSGRGLQISVIFPRVKDAT